MDIKSIWYNFTEKEKIFSVFGAILLVITIVVFLVLMPLYSKQDSLQNQLLIQNKTAQDFAKVKNARRYNFETITRAKAKKIIAKMTKNREIKNTIASKKDKKQLTLSVSKQNFNKLLNILKQIKTKYGIIVNEATIKKTSDGLVDAKLTLKMP